MSVLADLLGTLFERRYRGAGALHDGDLPDLSKALNGSAGEVTGAAIARSLLERYATSDATTRAAWFRFLATEMDVDPDAVQASAEAYRTSPDKEHYRHLMEVCEPPRQEVFRRLNQVPGATAQLVQMREHLRALAAEMPELGRVDLDLRHLFASWFNRGFLVLRPINWQSPAHILEKIIAYEAVHAIESWDDLRLRVEPEDRRCFAFFHPAMPDEPLIFVEVALTTGIPGAIHDVLAEGRDALDPMDADTAVFYSISNCQAGLAGISFGNSLIKQVVADLSRELPQLKRFVTLSPIPGLMDWLAEQGEADAADDPKALRQLAAHYLLEAKGRGHSPRDPVARFHLTNGALVHDIHARADLSDRGLRQSGGAMVNYLYDLTKISEKHESFAATGAVAASSDVQSLARAGKPALTS